MKHKIKQYGFKPDPIKDEDYHLLGGQIEEEILQPNGDWTAFLPPQELQAKNGFESMNCTSYGTLNAIETLLRKKK